MIEPQSAHEGESAETEKATFGPPPSSTPPLFNGLIGRSDVAWPFASAWPLERTGRSVPPTTAAGGGSAIIADALGPPASPMGAVSTFSDSVGRGERVSTAVCGWPTAAAAGVPVQPE